MRFFFWRFVSLAAFSLALTLMITACGPKAEPSASESSTGAEGKGKAAVAKAAESPAPGSSSEAGKTVTPGAEEAVALKPKPGETLAVFETSMGNFTVHLFTDKAPLTSTNFIELAEGKKGWAENGQMVKKPLYNGCKIFRVVQGFMFQTGSATDSALYEPGFNIPDEMQTGITFSKPGMVAMANKGVPNSGACQFFVTTSPEWHMGDGKFAIFGEVIDGMETVRKIDSIETVSNPDMDGESSLPLKMPVIKKVTIERGK